MKSQQIRSYCIRNRVTHVQENQAGYYVTSYEMGKHGGNVWRPTNRASVARLLKVLRRGDIPVNSIVIPVYPKNPFTIQKDTEYNNDVMDDLKGLVCKK